ncbi:MAG TPA: metalloregulator ArsR/SmtB family transcription factor [Solirubrobacteraceae bacterium]|jgi:DNA-binding transcriptional ArsR family regulator|nr:metalloregulator ArsR/SmtB family transcription factor [Solirubrobacteraceae bacterium]
MTEPNIAFVANLLADPSRAAMCLALAGGEARPAGELAARAGVSAQTASNHLAKLIAGRILRVEQQGRWRYYRLAGADVGHAVEALAVVAPPLPQALAVDGMAADARRLKNARTCYSHLAGRLGVALADALIAERWLEDDGRCYRLTPAGTRSLHALGIDVVVGDARAPARRCLDWTERRPHVAGPVGTALAKVALDRGWVRRLRGTRAVAVTPPGRAGLRKVFNLRWEERP